MPSMAALPAENAEDGVAFVPTSKALGDAKAALGDAAEAAKALKDKFGLVYEELAPKVRSYSVQLRPWSEFFIFEKPDPQAGFEFQRHVEVNMGHFQANYLFIACALTSIAIFMHPSWFVLISLLTGGWALYMAKGGFDPDWKPKVGGVEMTSGHRLLVMSAGSMALFFLVLG